MKVAGTLAYDNFVQIEGPENYQLIDASYVENATGENGSKYGYYTFTYQNIVPVKATGFLDPYTETYIYTTPGEKIAASLELKR